MSGGGGAAAIANEPHRLVVCVCVACMAVWRGREWETGSPAYLSGSAASKALRLEWSRMVLTLAKQPRSNFLALNIDILAVWGVRGQAGSGGRSAEAAALALNWRLPDDDGKVSIRIVPVARGEPAAAACPVLGVRACLPRPCTRRQPRPLWSLTPLEDSPGGGAFCRYPQLQLCRRARTTHSPLYNLDRPPGF